MNITSTFEVIVPVRPGEHDRYPVVTNDYKVTTKEIETTGGLSVVYRDQLLASKADIVIFKHDDLWIRDVDNFLSQVAFHARRYPVIGIAGTTSYSSIRHPSWWMQGQNRYGLNDGLTRGMVSHPQPGNALKQEFVATLFGPPGAVVVIDGCCMAISRLLVDVPVDDIAKCFDPSYTTHFYDIALSCNVTLLAQSRGLRSGCYVIVSDIAHRSPGVLTPDWEAASRKFGIHYNSKTMPPLIVGG